MEPTAQLDAPNRGLPESRVKRFAKRKSASRTPSIFLVNPSLFSTSQIERLGSRWLWKRRFGAPQGQSWGQLVRLRRDATAGTRSAVRRSRGVRILEIETIGDGSPVRLVGRALHQHHRTAETAGSFDALGGAVHLSVNALACQKSSSRVASFQQAASTSAPPSPSGAGESSRLLSTERTSRRI